jgi:hypothetical protein
LTALLAEICQPGPAQITLDEEDLRECEGRKNPRESEREKERERERERFGSKPHSRAQLPSQALVCVSGDY